MRPTNKQRIREIRGWGHTAFDEAKRASHKEVPTKFVFLLAVGGWWWMIWDGDFLKVLGFFLNRFLWEGHISQDDVQ